MRYLLKSEYQRERCHARCYKLVCILFYLATARAVRFPGDM